MKNRKNKNKLWRFLYKFHRYTGLCSALVLLMLAVTGIALNHTDRLKLDSTMIQSSTLLDWYGIKSPSELSSYALKKHWITQSEQQIFFNHSPLLKTKNKLKGAIETTDYIVIAFNQSLLLVTLEGEIIEQTQFDHLEKIGLNPQQQVIIQANQLIQTSDDDLLSWHPYSKQDISWSHASKPPSFLAKKIKNAARSTILPLERVLLDLHSGRFFGIMGVFIVDLAGLLLILLALSGCAIWIKHKLRSR
jgi:hypothetical protein